MNFKWIYLTNTGIHLTNTGIHQIFPRLKSASPKYSCLICHSLSSMHCYSVRVCQPEFRNQPKQSMECLYLFFLYPLQSTSPSFPWTYPPRYPSYVSSLSISVEGFLPCISLAHLFQRFSIQAWEWHHQSAQLMCFHWLKPFLVP